MLPSLSVQSVGICPIKSEMRRNKEVCSRSSITTLKFLKKQTMQKIEKCSTSYQLVIKYKICTILSVLHFKKCV